MISEIYLRANQINLKIRIISIKLLAPSVILGDLRAMKRTRMIMPGLVVKA